MSLLAYVKSTFENNAHQVDNIIASYPSILTGSNLSLGSTVWYVVESILNDGIRHGKNINGKFVMRWEWYNTEYLAKVFTNSAEQKYSIYCATVKLQENLFQEQHMVMPE